VVQTGLSIGANAVWCQNLVGMQSMLLITCEDEPVELHWNTGIMVGSFFLGAIFGSMSMMLVMPSLMAKETASRRPSTMRRLSSLGGGGIPTSRRPSAAAIPGSAQRSSTPGSAPPALSRTNTPGMLQRQGTISLKTSENFTVTLPQWLGGKREFARFGVGRYFAAAGSLMVCIMGTQLTGLLALQGPFRIQFSPGHVAGAFVLALTVSLAVTFVLAQMTRIMTLNRNHKLRMLTSVVLGLSINGVHSILLAGASFMEAPLSQNIGSSSGPVFDGDIALIACIVSIALSGAQVLWTYAQVTGFSSQLTAEQPPPPPRASSSNWQESSFRGSFRSNRSQSCSSAGPSRAGSVAGLLPSISHAPCSSNASFATPPASCKGSVKGSHPAQSLSPAQSDRRPSGPTHAV